jgi:hypothetical protein
MAAFRPGLWRHVRGHVILLGAHRAMHRGAVVAAV